MPDQLVCTTVSALLRISAAQPQYRARAFDAIVALVEDIVNRLSTMDGAHYVIFRCEELTWFTFQRSTF